LVGHWWIIITSMAWIELYISGAHLQTPLDYLNQDYFAGAGATAGGKYLSMTG
jgi:hypothetical protein